MKISSESLFSNKRWNKIYQREEDISVFQANIVSKILFWIKALEIFEIFIYYN